MAERKTLARPYAEAAFELAREHGALESWSHMLRVAAMVAADSRVAAAVHDPEVPRQELLQLFADACGEALDGMGRRFLELLLENRRIVVLPEISDLFEQLKAEAEHRIEAEVISAGDLSAAQQRAIAEALEKRLDRKVNLNTRVDSSILGGVVIRAGDLVIDGSVRARLQGLAAQLTK